MYTISKLLKLSNKLDDKNPRMADKLEKTAANMIDTFVPQNVLEQGWSSMGGGNLDGSLGGYHTQIQLSGGANFDPQTINDATSLITELDGELPDFNMWQQQHPNIENPNQVYNILQVWQPFYLAGISDIGQLQSILNMSGPIDLQFASTAPSAAHQSWGITSNEIMEHERAHARGESSSPEAYMQHAVPGADFLNSSGMGGNINPVAGYYETLMNQLMAGQDAGEYGPNFDIWKRVVREHPYPQ